MEKILKLYFWIVSTCELYGSHTFIPPFVRHHNVDVSVAVSTSSGLITPIVFDADKKVCTPAQNNEYLWGWSTP